MRISDWSSDVCSSDLSALQAELVEQYFAELLGAADRERLAGEAVDLAFDAQHLVREFARQPRQIVAVDHEAGALHRLDEIGRASCRERVCQYVYSSVVAESLKQ